MATRRKRVRDVAAAAAAAGGRGANTNNNNNSNNNTKNKNIGGIEENTMAMLDSSGFGNSSSDNNHYLVDDRLAFLEAVRAASLVPENGTAPTNKMCEAIFDILKDEKSLDLIMSSYQLLNELDKRFPRVYLSEAEKSESSSNSVDVVVVEEAWSPFTSGIEVSYVEEKANKTSGGLIDPLGFHSLIEEVARVTNQKNSEVLGTQSLRDMLLLQYLVKVIENDLLPRSRAFKENMNWDILRESLLNLLLGSRTITYKGVIKDYLRVMCEISHRQTESQYDSSTAGSSSTELCNYSDNAVALAFPEVESSICAALKKLLLMILELDSLRNVADHQGLTSRADGVRTPAADIILDELTYNVDLLALFFQVFDDQDLKLKLIVQYFQKYIPKSSVRTRKSNGSADTATFDGLLKYLSNSTSAKNIIKKIGSDVVQLLLAHAFKAYVSLSIQHSAKGISHAEEDAKDSSLVEICKYTISAVTCLKKECRGTEIIRLSKEALFTAATILSNNS